MRPRFNVTDFQDVINVQMNNQMRRLLIQFIGEVEDDDLEVELRAFKNALSDPQGSLYKKTGTRRRRPQQAST